MPLAKCIRTCWDSQKTKLYQMGMIEEIPEDHVFLTMGNPCFEPLTPEGINKLNANADEKVHALTLMVARLSTMLEEMGKLNKSEIIPEMATEAKRGPGRPHKQE